MSAQHTEVIDGDEAREIAGEWHGGQWSSLYSLSSTATVDSGAWMEVCACLRMLQAGQYSPEEIERELPRLTALRTYIEANEPRDDEQ